MLRSISRLRLPHLRLSPLSSFRRNLVGDTSDEDDVAVSVLPPRDPDAPPKLFVVQPRLRPEPILDAKLSEALNLATSLEDRRDGDWTSSQEKDKSSPPHLVVQNPMARSSGRADKFFGPGTVDNVKCHLQALDSEDGPSAVFVNAILSGIQQRNLEIAWGKPVLDRIGLILEIFNAHAQTKEAKLQSELAALMYRSTRLVRARGPSGRLTFGMSGEAEVVSAKGKGSGGRGFLSGAGESEIQLQRRRIQERRERLLHQIEEVRRTRALQRYARKRRGGSQGQSLATIAVVGYTNAGKSTLVSALSHSDLYRDDRLFATVDPRLRNVVLPSGRKALLSDTVGFISDLPVQLVEAFHATLEEVVDADLLVHVLDSSAKDLEEQRSTVLKVLQQIGVSEEKIQNMIEVWNKIDLLGRECEAIETLHDDKNLGEVKRGQGTFSSQDGNPLHTSVGDLAPEGLENQTAPNNFVDADGCLFHDENEHADSPIKSGDIEPELLSSEHMDDDDACRNEPDRVCWEQVDIVDSELSMDNNGLGSTLALAGESAICQPINVKRVETSATTRVGLQELLQAIDEKLSPNSSETGNTAAIFERKWRPHSKNDKIISVH